MNTVLRNIYNNIPKNPFYKDTDDNEYIISDNDYDNNESPEKNIDQLNTSTEDPGEVLIMKDNLILKINSEIEKAKGNYNKKLPCMDNADKKLIFHLNVALREILAKSQYIVKKMMNKGIIELTDRTDLEEQYGYLKELNNISSNIYGKYQK